MCTGQTTLTSLKQTVCVIIIWTVGLLLIAGVGLNRPDRQPGGGADRTEIVLDSAQIRQQLKELARVKGPDGRPSPQYEAVEQLMQQAENQPPLYDYLLHEAEELFFNATSPWRNEELFLHILQYDLDHHGSTFKGSRREHLYRLIRKNRVGQPACDIRLQMRNGSRKRLSDFSGRYLLLVFFDPECGPCMEVLNLLRRSTDVDRLIRHDRLTLLTVYTDHHPDTWAEIKAHFPMQWQVAIDADQVVEDQHYDLKAMPTLYLLSPQQHVVLKDADVSDILTWLRTHPL